MCASFHLYTGQTYKSGDDGVQGRSKDSSQTGQRALSTGARGRVLPVERRPPTGPLACAAGLPPHLHAAGTSSGDELHQPDSFSFMFARHHSLGEGVTWAADQRQFEDPSQ